jgi:hypothetical protein
LVASISEYEKEAERRAEQYRTMIGRLKPPTRREWLERCCIADFAVSHHRGHFLPQLRKFWREQQGICECSELEREVFSKFAAMSEEQLIALAIPYYPEWSTTVTVSHEIATVTISNESAAKWRNIEPLLEPGTFRLPIQDIGIGILHNLIGRSGCADA